ncbi:hypothetical protein Tco_0681473 [Tanacetum coccineum]|uniref:Uncharacterized protein n=1 Tax=Tanacetum coccineum TaxID=301880 RepID=A0ABQ4XNF1_9ASTR
MQKRTTMCNYLKNMAGYKHNQLRHKSFDDIHKLFDKDLKRVNTFVPMDTEKVEELDRESTKKKKVEDETKQAELKECFEIIPFDEDAVNTIPLATKQAPIVDYKITRDERKIYYHITRADRSTQVYMRFENMLKMFDKEDLESWVRDTKDIRIGSNPFLRPYPHNILYHITEFDLAVNISQSFNWEDFLIRVIVYMRINDKKIPEEIFPGRMSQRGCN